MLSNRSGSGRREMNDPMSQSREIARELTVESLSTQNLITLFWLLCRGDAVVGLTTRREKNGVNTVADYSRHHRGY
jgi:hypothetical protein